jgi:hypothetical protein
VSWKRFRLKLESDEHVSLHIVATQMVLLKANMMWLHTSQNVPMVPHTKMRSNALLDNYHAHPTDRQQESGARMLTS